MKSKINILAPAGNWESLKAAINAGTDEIYFGIGELNMRAAGANNFSIDDLKEIGLICRKAKIKSWVTLNTVVYDEEIEGIKNILKEIKKAKITGIIAADLAVIKAANKEKIEVCVSTQMSVSNLETIRFLNKWVDRIVLARELNLEQIKKITEGIKKEKIKVEIEVFGHGAMCVGISGRCQMSLYHHNLSANRGKCGQMCRRKYEVKDLDSGKEMILENNLIMSRSDLCTIGLLDKLVESGISTIKIEGRARSADYVDTVVRVYKKALNLIEENKYGKKEKEELLKELKTVFNRGFSNGFYLGRSTNEWAVGENNLATETKILLGKIDHFYPKIGVAEIKLTTSERIQNGDNYLIIGPSTGIVRGMFFDIKMDKNLLNFKVTKKVRKNDKLFICRANKN
ncbi:MAG: U32 family peptidase [Candidatus Shapirobacteria bacterium]|nr:U32 family peptidase [Candidatus Shapirobacteria bacterium]MDD4410121.1 U32 family peptidase [Candidatus Shapirobacteria bacterium]